MMASGRVYLSALLPFSTVLNSNTNSNLLRLCSICLILCSHISPSIAPSTYEDRALAIVQSIDDYLCQNYVSSCTFRQRYHQSAESRQHGDNCKPLLILHSCLHHDPEIPRICHPSIIHRARVYLENDTPKRCFTSSVYKSFRAQHLRSTAPTRLANVKCHVVVLFCLAISFVIKIRACC